MRDINLLQEQTSTASGFEAKASLKPALLTLGVLIILIVGAYAALVVLSAQNVANSLVMAAEAVQYQPALETKNAMLKKQAEVAASEELLTVAKDNEAVNTELLNSITGALTGDAFLQTVTLDSNKNAGVSGIAPTRADVASFVYNLKQTGLFTDVEIVSVAQVLQAQEGSLPVYSFSVLALMKEGGQGE